MPGYGMHGGGGYGLLFGLGGFILTLLVIAAIVLLIMALVKRDKNLVAGPPAHVPPTPVPPSMQILDDRLARGDISVEDYHARKTALLGQVPAPQPEDQPAPPPADDANPKDERKKPPFTEA